MNFSKFDYIFTDGATLNNGLTNATGGSSVFFKDNHINNFYEPLPKIYGIPTNNKCELYAILKAFEIYFECYERDTKNIKNKKNLIIFSDSKYIINSLTKWIFIWKKNNWKTSTGNEVKNRSLIEIIYYYINRYSKIIDIKFIHVKAHKNPPPKNKTFEYFLWYGNYKADLLAKKARKLYK